MDTREKILPVEKARELTAIGDWVLLVGAFDPLTATQARRIAALKQSDKRLLAVVQPADEELLPTEARAILVAALREVDAVVIADSADGFKGTVVEDRAGEAERSAEFIRFILRRQATATA
jgi:hypothetical protein